MNLPAELCYACGVRVTPRVEWARDGRGDYVSATCPSCLATMRRLRETPENVAAADADEASAR
jgi:Fe-S oxidoreductase